MVHEPDPQWLLTELIAAVERLGQGADAQLAYVAALGSPGVADELAQELDDVLDAAIGVPGLLSEPAVAALRVLDGRLETMSGPEHEDLWTEEALRRSSEWAEVRRLAASALHLLTRDRHRAESS